MEMPPVGVKPRWLMDELRFDELVQAFGRRFKRCYPLPIEWVEEYNEICERLKSEVVITELFNKNIEQLKHGTGGIE